MIPYSILPTNFIENKEHAAPAVKIGVLLALAEFAV